VPAAESGLGRCCAEYRQVIGYNWQDLRRLHNSPVLSLSRRNGSIIVIFWKVGPKPNASLEGQGSSSPGDSDPQPHALIPVGMRLAASAFAGSATGWLHGGGGGGRQAARPGLSVGSRETSGKNRSAEGTREPWGPGRSRGKAVTHRAAAAPGQGTGGRGRGSHGERPGGDAPGRRPAGSHPPGSARPAPRLSAPRDRTPRRCTLTVSCPRRPAWKLLTMAFMLSMARGISAGLGGASSTLA